MILPYTILLYTNLLYTYHVYNIYAILLKKQNSINLKNKNQLKTLKSLPVSLLFLRSLFVLDFFVLQLFLIDRVCSQVDAGGEAIPVFNVSKRVCSPFKHSDQFPFS